MRRWDGKLFGVLFGVGAVVEQPRGFLGGKHGDGAELAVDLARAHADELIQLRAGLLDALLRGGFRNPFLTFLFGALLTSALEYFTSWVMEKLFHMRWWDYSHYKFQINGRVCLLNSTCFGLACVLLCHLVQPWLWARIVGLGAAVTIPLASFISGIYLMDTVLSVRSAIQLSAQMGKLRDLQSELKDFVAEKREESQERNAERRLEALSRARALRDGADIFERRLLHSHPDIRKSREDLLTAIRARLAESEEDARREAARLHAIYGDKNKS